MKILQLPHLPLREVLVHMLPSDVFLLSVCSKQSETAISGSTPYRNCDIRLVESEASVMQYSLHDRKLTSVVVKWWWDHIPEQVEQKNSDIQIYGLKCRLTIDPFTNIPKFWCPNEKEFATRLLLNLCKVFRSKFDSRIILEASHAQGLPKIKQIEGVSMKGAVSKAIHVENFLKDVEVTDYAHLAINIYDRALNPDCKLYSIDNVCIDIGWFVTGPDLLRFDCRNITVHESKIDREFFVQFVKNWMDGRYTRLETLFVINTSLIDREALQGSFELKPWNEKERAQNYVYKGPLKSRCTAFLTDMFDCSGRERWDDRNSRPPCDLVAPDGRLATIRIHLHHFLFYVWHERFPEETTLKEAVVWHNGR